jgi:phytoene synthase
MNGRLSTPTQDDWLTCRSIARVHGRSFFLASHMMGAERQRAIHAAYAFCRMADDIVDTATGNRSETERALTAWEGEIDHPKHPVARAFAHSRSVYGIPDQPVHELFDGMRSDLNISRYETWGDLRTYCYLAAGTVGLIVAPILGCSDRHALPRAAELGIAMQLTNILRDVGEDGRMGRVYLPLEDLDRFDVCPNRMLAGNPGAGFPSLMRFEIDRARALYRTALDGVHALSPAGRMTTLLAARLYAGILDEVERNSFDVLNQRTVVSRFAKGQLAVSATARFLLLQSGRTMTNRPVSHVSSGLPRTDPEGRWS